MVEMLFLALALSMDALAVSITIGICKSEISKMVRLRVALTFGLFQAGMTLLGYLLASSFKSYIEGLDHWIALILLSYIGFSMLRAAYKNEIDNFDPTSTSTLLLNGIATSIDALAIGITLAALNKDIASNASVIGIITFILSLFGVNIGNKLGLNSSKYSLVVGGIVLLFIGLKIFIEHTLF